MSSDVGDRVAGTEPAWLRDGDVWARTYTYLRTAIVGLLVGLGVAVFYQAFREGGFHPLASVSAYYYTPAQAMFVGALVGMAACMIALKGASLVEEVFLNLGGMFAAVVAMVPSSRGADYQTAVRACQRADSPLLTQKASTGLNCPSVRALAAATTANVENNVFALLVVGFLGLVVAWLFARRFAARSGENLGPDFWWGFGAAVLVWAISAFAFVTSIAWFIGHAHYLAAAGLLICIVVVAVANALRHDETQPRGARDALLRDPRRFDRYAWLAWAMVVVAGVGVVLVVLDAFALFWLEIAVGLLFASFWTVQTIELLPPKAGSQDDQAGVGPQA
jgi:hypothetical protein